MWRGERLLGVWFPEATDGATRARMRRRHPDAVEASPPERMMPAIEAIRARVRGEEADVGEIPLVRDGVPDFHRRVYDLALAIPRGRTATYGEIAARLGDPSLARAVGQALGANPGPILIPCHRVVGAGGWEGGFSGAGGVATKRRLLEIEGAREPEPPGLFD
jgi:methylated-DNA-[protein]-cysteine S-methyltransferase